MKAAVIYSIIHAGMALAGILLIVSLVVLFREITKGK